MKLYVEIEIEGDAIYDAGSEELAEILRKVASDVEESRSTHELCRGKIAVVGAFPVRDSNGNTIGVYGFKR